VHATGLFGELVTNILCLLHNFPYGTKKLCLPVRSGTPEFDSKPPFFAEFAGQCVQNQ
jgi:hypothetical protein